MSFVLSPTPGLTLCVYTSCLSMLVCTAAVLLCATASMPKRLILAHMHYTEPSSPSADPTAVPSMRIANSSWVMGGADSNPVSWVVTAMGFDPTQTQVNECVGGGGGGGGVHEVCVCLRLG